VVVADIDAGRAAATAAELTGALCIEIDESEEAAVAPTVPRIAAAGHGSAGVDILVNNAAVCDAASFDEISRAAWDRDIAVSLTGSYLMSQAVLPAMRARGGGVIVNVASVNGIGFYGNEAYSAAKAGLLSLTRSLAVGYGKDGIRCNAVVPGTIATPIWQQRVDRDPQILQRLRRWYPLGRVGTPEDVAAAITFLAGPEASWITGVALPVDGGLLAGNGPMTDDILGT
jgi:NAD(P)-dependent dehydrogenase (short-subunit alcohol dehydrogenase family)